MILTSAKFGAVIKTSLRLKISKTYWTIGKDLPE
jgi:hypothetical protein